LSFIKLIGLSTREFERETKLSNGTISNAKSGKVPLSFENVEKIVDKYSTALKYFGFEVVHLAKYGKEDILILGNEDEKELTNDAPLSAKELSIRKPKTNLSTSKKKIPFYDAEASAGPVETDMTPISAPSGTIDIGDLLQDSQAAIRIYGNSMIPNYPPGCVVGLVKCNKDFIEPGEVYVVETEDRRMLKRLFYRDDNPASEYITCYSDNTMKFKDGARDGKLAYPPFDIHFDNIISLFTVTGVIKRNANSVIMHRSDIS
jgi:hypothetical protein